MNQRVFVCVCLTVKWGAFSPDTFFYTHFKLSHFQPFRFCSELYLFPCGEGLLLQSVHRQEASPSITGSARKYVLRILPQHRLCVFCAETT